MKYQILTMTLLMIGLIILPSNVIAQSAEAKTEAEAVKAEANPADVGSIDAITKFEQGTFTEAQVQSVIDKLEDVKNRCDTMISMLESRIG